MERGRKRNQPEQAGGNESGEKGGMALVAVLSLCGFPRGEDFSKNPKLKGNASEARAAALLVEGHLV